MESVIEAKLIRAIIEIELLAQEVTDAPLTAIERASYATAVGSLRRRARLLLAQLETGAPAIRPAINH